MAKVKPFYGEVLTGQVLTDEHIIEWAENLNVTKLALFTPTDISINRWKESFSKVEIINEVNAKNLKDSLVRGVVGNVALGGVGAIAGVVSAKSDTTFNVLITYHNHEIDLIECDVKLYTKLTQQANKNKRLEITEYEDVYLTEEELQAEFVERRNQPMSGDEIFGCGCLIIAIGAIVWFFVWLFFS